MSFDEFSESGFKSVNPRLKTSTSSPILSRSSSSSSSASSNLRCKLRDTLISSNLSIDLGALISQLYLTTVGSEKPSSREMMYLLRLIFPLITLLLLLPWLIMILVIRTFTLRLRKCIKQTIKRLKN